MTPRLILALCLALVPFTASAAPAPAAKATAKATPAARVPATRTYEYDPDDVDGEILSPDGVDVSYRAYGDHPSLVKVRTHFIPQMLKMADDL